MGHRPKCGIHKGLSLRVVWRSFGEWVKLVTAMFANEQMKSYNPVSG